MSQIRYSVANLAGYVRNKKMKEKVQFGILNPAKLKEGKRQYMALGGGAMLKEAGRKMLEERFGATGFEFDKNTKLYDARFRADEKHLESIFGTLSTYQPDFEHSPSIDILEELSGKEFPEEYGPLLGDLAGVSVLPLFSVRQAPTAGGDTSIRALTDVPTRRLFRIFELVLDSVSYKQLLNSPMVRILSPDELETTRGGATAGVAKDGALIQNNLFLY